ncbi:MAG: acyl-CoA/acyl-ACP dehydrogenase [Acidobacteria bacterium]|nr:acyl-CoA/acyl-ACP dehydrogenase [Acidobacteriota bacterium]
MANEWRLAPEGEALVETAGEIAAGVVRRSAADVDREARFPAENIDALRTAGLLSLVSARGVGGQGQGLRAAAAVGERLARECASTAMVTIMHYAAAAVIEQHGLEALRRDIAERGHLATLAFSEAGSRSHFWIPTGTATRTPDGIRLDAAKQLITAAGHAGVYVWSSRPSAAEGLSTIWAVPSGSAGLSTPRPFDGMGLRGNASAAIIARDVTIPESARLGEDGKGFDVMLGVVLPYFSLQSCAVSLGMMEGVLARTLSHVTASRFSYDGSRIADLPQVRGHVARMRLKTDMVRGLLLDALDAVEGGRADAMLRVLEAKAAGSETSLEVHDLAMRVCGGAAYRRDVGVERFFRDSRASTVMAPVTDALYEFIGRALCGMPVFG